MAGPSQHHTDSRPPGSDPSGCNPVGGRDESSPVRKQSIRTRSANRMLKPIAMRKQSLRKQSSEGPPALPLAMCCCTPVSKRYRQLCAVIAAISASRRSANCQFASLRQAPSAIARDAVSSTSAWAGCRTAVHLHGMCLRELPRHSVQAPRRDGNAAKIFPSICTGRPCSSWPRAGTCARGRWKKGDQDVTPEHSPTTAMPYARRLL